MNKRADRARAQIVRQAEGEDQRKDHQACEKGDHEVGSRDDHRFTGHVVVSGEVARVGEHRSHPQAQAEEGLTRRLGEHAQREDLAEIRLEVEGVARTGSRQRRGEDGEAHDDQSQQRHQDDGAALDSPSNPAGDDEDRDRHEQQVPAGGIPAGRDLAEEAGRVAAEAGEQSVPGVAKGPARDHGVVGQDEKATEDKEHAQRSPGVAAEVGERQDRALLRAPPDRELRQHDRQADQRHHDDVQEDEGRPAVLGGEVREAPHVAQADRRSDGGEHEAETAAPLLSRRLVHLSTLPVWVRNMEMQRSSTIVTCPRRLGSGAAASRPA